MRRLYIALLLALFATASLNAAPLNLRELFKFKKKKAKTDHVVTIYDTVRVVVTDTVIVHAKPSARIDTLTIIHTPRQIDSLIDLWHTLSVEQSREEYFKQYSFPLEDESSMPRDSIYKRRLEDMVSPVHLPYNSVVRNYIDYYLENKWSPLSKVIGLSSY